MDVQSVNPRRKILSYAVSSILSEVGFTSCEKAALETLTEMLQSLLCQIGESAKNYCELAGRTQPLAADVLLALVNAGIRVDNISLYGNRSNRTVLPPLQQQTQSKPTHILQAGVKQSHPPYIPSYLPALPDPHAYIRTPTHKQPVTEYEAIREKASSQKRDIERALTRFKAKTGKTHSLFLKDDSGMFPFIACTPQFPTYLALIPQDQIFDSDDESEESPAKKKKKESKDTQNNEENDRNEDTEQNDDSIKEEVIDNPYLRPAKIPPQKVPPGSKLPAEVLH